jgi:hypothetical protein
MERVGHGFGWPLSGEDEDSTRGENLTRFAAYAIILLLAVVPPAMGIVGWDFLNAYRGDVLIGRHGYYLFNPWPLDWLCYPFAVLPPIWGSMLWNLVAAFGFIFALNRLGGRPLWFALSLPCFWTFTQGQMEGLLALGLALALTSSPLWAGLGLALLSLKPQFGLLAIPYVLFQRRDWRLLLAAAVLYGASVLRWGFWFDDWLAALRIAGDVNREHPDNLSLFPYALVLLPLLFAFRKNLRIWLLVQSMCVPVLGLSTFAPALTLRQSRALPFIVLATWAMYLAKVTHLVQLPGLGFVMLVALVWEIWELYGTQLKGAVVSMRLRPS